VGEIVSPFATIPIVGERGQPVGKVVPIAALRSPLVPLLLFWQRENKMMVLGRLAKKSRRPI